MAQISNFEDHAYTAQHRSRRLPSAKLQADKYPAAELPREELEMHEFWPDVCCRRTEDFSEVDPANRPARVFSEIFLLLAAMGAAILAVSLFVTPPA